jgi:hypothetical protein
MGLSETIVAAIIGALATMGTAIFQLVRNRAPAESRPKKNRMRSVIATIALMIGCVVGGYAWSTLRALSAREETATVMREELAKQAEALRASLAAPAHDAASIKGEPIPARSTDAGAAESSAHLPPCRLTAQIEDAGPSTCSAAAAQHVALCAAVPANARTGNLHVFARVPGGETPWLERDAGATALGSLRIADKQFEYASSADQRAVCLEVSNWSVEETLAVKLVVDFDYETNTPELTASAPGGQAL